MDEPRYEYENFKVDPPKVDDGWYLVKDGMTYRVDVPINKMRFTKSINILTGEVHYPSNADRIRAMSDEELARLFADENCGYCRIHDFCFAKGCQIDCEDIWLDWLKEEVSE